MPYRVSTEGMKELEQMLRDAGNAAQGAASAGLYEGAGVIADAVSKAVHGIAAVPFKYAAGGNKRQPSQEEKAILEAAPKGVAKFKKTGVSVDTSVGFNQAGYAAITWNHARTGARTKYKVTDGKAKQAKYANGGTSQRDQQRDEFHGETAVLPQGGEPEQRKGEESDRGQTAADD